MHEAREWGGGGIPSPIPWRPEEEGLVIGGRTRQGHIRLAEEPLIWTKTERRPLARTASREEEKRTNLSLSDKLSINEQKGIKRKFRNARRPLEANKQKKRKKIQLMHGYTFILTHTTKIPIKPAYTHKQTEVYFI